MKKKLVSLMLAATMVASLAACGSKKTEEATSTVHKDITAAQYDGTVTSDAEIYRKGFTTQNKSKNHSDINRNYRKALL